jgi:hypothetical protein
MGLQQQHLLCVSIDKLDMFPKGMVKGAKQLANILLNTLLANQLFETEQDISSKCGELG